MTDPWTTPEKGFEKYDGPRSVDFQSVDTKATELREFIRSEAQAVARPQQAVETVTLPDGRRGLLSQRDGEWELAIHLRRDFFQIITGTSREGVLREATR